MESDERAGDGEDEGGDEGALLWAAECADIETLTSLLLKGVSPNIFDKVREKVRVILELENERY